MLGSNPSLLRRELGVPSRPYVAVPEVCLMARVRLGLSYTFYVGFSLIHTICRSRLASFWISFGGNCSVCSCRLCALEEVNLGASCMVILDQKFASYILKLDN